MLDNILKGESGINEDEMSTGDKAAGTKRHRDGPNDGNEDTSSQNENSIELSSDDEDKEIPMKPAAKKLFSLLSAQLSSTPNQ